MESEKINGRNQIILNEGESVYINQADSDSDDCIEVRLEGGKLISTPLRKPKEIFDVDYNREMNKIEKTEDCDEWISIFIETYNRLKEIAKESGGKVGGSQVVIKLCKTFGDNKKTGKLLEVNLNKHFQQCMNGPVLFLDDFNDEEFKYIFAWVMDYYIVDNYGNKPITNMDVFTNMILFTNEPDYDFLGNRLEPSAVLDCHNIDIFDNAIELKDIFYEIVKNHNNGISSKYLIEDLRNKISGVKNIVDDKLKASIEESKEYRRRIFEQFERTRDI